MSSSSQPSTWYNPRQFCVPLPPEIDSTNERFLNLACSGTHVALSNNTHVYIYSLPEFNLTHILRQSTLPPLIVARPVQIRGHILVATVYNDSKNSAKADCLYHIWDLPKAKLLGTVTLDEYAAGTHISICEVAKPEEEQQPVGQALSQKPLLIISSEDKKTHTGILQTYMLPSSEAKGSSLSTLPTATIYPIHVVGCLASMGRTAVTGGFDETVRAWDIIARKCLLVLIGHNDAVADVNIDEDRIYSSGRDCTIRVWDRQHGDCLQIFNVPHTAIPTPACILPSSHSGPSSLIASRINQSFFHTIFIWDLLSGELIHQIKWLNNYSLGPIIGKAFTLVTEKSDEDSDRHRFEIWDSRSGQLLAYFSTRPRYPYLRFCSQGSFLIAVSKQGERYVLKVWDFAETNTVAAGAPTMTGISERKKHRSPKNLIRRLFR